MRIRYTGGRSRYEVNYNRTPFYFTPENNHTLDIQDQKVINYIFSLPNREFEAVMEEAKPQTIQPEILPFNGKGDVVNLKPEITEPKAEIKEEVKKKKHKKHKGGK